MDIKLEATTMDIQIEVATTVSEASSDRKVHKPRRGRKSLGKTTEVRRSGRLTAVQKTGVYNDKKMDELFEIFDKKGNFKTNKNQIKVENNGPKLEKIIGATEVQGRLMFLCKWQDKDATTLMSSDEAKILHPYPVMDFYESCMVWDDAVEDPEVSF